MVNRGQLNRGLTVTLNLAKTKSMIISTNKKLVSISSLSSSDF